MSSQDEAIRGRIPPHSEEAERAVLGAILQDPERIPDLAEFLRAEDFFNRRHRLIFGTFVDLYERSVAVDLLTVGEALRAQSKLGEIGGNAYLASLTGAVTSAAHLKHHGSLVAKTALLRRLIGESTSIIDEAFATPPDPESVGKLLDSSEHRIFQVAQNRDNEATAPIKTVLEEAFRRIELASHRRELSGVGSGFYELDEMLGGFNEGELTIIAARPAMGKTAFVLNLMDRAATRRPEGQDHDPVVLFFSLEMGQVSIAQRMLCARARVDAHKLRTGRIPVEEYSLLTQAAGELSSSKLFIDDTPGLSVMALRSRARRCKQNHGLDLIVIDYLQLMTAFKAESRQQEISLISRSLKELSRELEVPVIALSQLSRAVESREDKRPQLSDLRESGSIEQDADVVLMLYRQEYYNPTEENRGKAEVICAKQRNGPTGSVKLQFFGSHLRFENPEHSMAEPILP